ncbi:MAG: hypothetical protein V1861_05620 [Candidatus Micrarchaeota archaeon]
MQAAVSNEPASSRAGMRIHQSGVFPATRKSLRFREIAPEKENRDWIVCDPQGSGKRTLRGHLLEVEPRLLEMAATNDDVGFAVATVDKSRQSAINKIGGEKGAGDSSMEAYFDILAKATINLGGADERHLRLALRLDQISDEGVIFAGGRNFQKVTESTFGRVLRQARCETDLRKYRYTLTSPFGDNESFDHNLELFSRALRNPGMVVSCKYSVSAPRRVTLRERPGFVMDEIRKLDDKVNGFFPLLPESFRSNLTSLAEVQTPFLTSLTKLGIRDMDHGVFVEIKLSVNDTDAKALIPFTKDTDDWQGTRKGYMEIFSNLFGMRGFNTFIGRARTNSILTPITRAMKDLEADGVAVIPVNGCYLKYWVGMPESDYTKGAIENAIIQRIRSHAPGPGFADLDFTPHVNLLDACGVDISQTRALFILKSLGMEKLPPATLDMSDFMLNFIENVHPIVQGVVFGRLWSEKGTWLSDGDKDNIAALRKICDLRRTIRDTEDFLGVLRRDETLPEDIKSRRSELEGWLIEFSAEKAGKIFRLLAEEISMFAHRK